MKITRCWYCGEFTTTDEALVAKGSSRGRLFCLDCKGKFESKRTANKELYIAQKVEVTLERAIRILEKQQNLKFDFDLYYEPFIVVSDFFRKDPLKFESAHEIAACVELLRNEIKVKTQQNVGRKRVDFILTDLKVALEIDGGLHRFSIGKDSQRDVFILNELNKDEKGWEIVRIPTSFIEQDISKLVPAIKTMYSEKQKLRRKYNGFIPSGYSKSNKMAHLSALNGVLPDYEIETMVKDTVSEEEFLNR